MNIDVLRTTLHTHAGDIDGSIDDPLPRLRTRIRRRNRAKTAVVAGVGAAAVVVAATVVPGLIGQNRDTLPADRPTSRPTPSLSTSVFRTGFPTSVDGDPLIASYVGKKGPSTGSVRFTATGHGLTFRPVCKLPRWVFAQSNLNPPMLHVWLNGHQIFDVSCSVFASSSTSTVPSKVTLPAKGGIVTAFVSVGIEIGGGPLGKRRFVPRPVAGAQLALGIYDQTGHTRTKAGFTLPVIHGTPGHELQLQMFVTQRLSTKVRDLHATLPASASPIVLTSGGGHGRGVVTTTVRGPSADSSGGTAGGLSQESLPAGGQRTVVVHAGKHVTGTLVLAYYAR